ncbi:MAG: HIT domain-containing protein [Dehalococcoidia bacterium]
MVYPVRQSDDSACEFCGIVSGRVPSQVRYQDDELIVFRNALKWVPVMLLIAPKRHMTQAEFWRSPLFARASSLAVELGESDSPDGFRLVSNFGDDAMQSQPHGHLHVIGGTDLGLYVDFPRKGDFWLRNYGKTDVDPKHYPPLHDRP